MFLCFVFFVYDYFWHVLFKVFMCMLRCVFLYMIDSRTLHYQGGLDDGKTRNYTCSGCVFFRDVLKMKHTLQQLELGLKL